MLSDENKHGDNIRAGSILIVDQTTKTAKSSHISNNK